VKGVEGQPGAGPFRYMREGLGIGVALAVAAIAFWVVSGDRVIVARAGTLIDLSFVATTFFVGTPVGALVFAATSAWHSRRVLRFLAGMLVVAPVTIPMALLAIRDPLPPSTLLGIAGAATVFSGAIFALAALDGS